MTCLVLQESEVFSEGSSPNRIRKEMYRPYRSNCKTSTEQIRNVQSYTLTSSCITLRSVNSVGLVILSRLVRPNHVSPIKQSCLWLLTEVNQI